jgi:hypothetical protein
MAYMLVEAKNTVAVIDSFLYHFGDGGGIAGILKYFINNCNKLQRKIKE